MAQFFVNRFPRAATDPGRAFWRMDPKEMSFRVTTNNGDTVAEAPGGGRLRYYANMSLLATLLGDSRGDAPVPRGRRLVRSLRMPIKLPGGDEREVRMSPWATELDLFDRSGAVHYVDMQDLPVGPRLTAFLDDLPAFLRLPMIDIRVTGTPNGGWVRAVGPPYDMAFHGGVDFGRLDGDESVSFGVFAPADGRVAAIGVTAKDADKQLGASVHLVHDVVGLSGAAYRFRTVYQHLAPASVEVAVGDEVTAGDRLGRTANSRDIRDYTGRRNSKLDVPTHLHFMVSFKAPRGHVVLGDGAIFEMPELFFVLDPFGVYDVNDGVHYALGSPRASLRHGALAGAIRKRLFDALHLESISVADAVALTTAFG